MKCCVWHNIRTIPAHLIIGQLYLIMDALIQGSSNKKKTSGRKASRFYAQEALSFIEQIIHCQSQSKIWQIAVILTEAILVKFSKIWSDSLHRTSWSAIEWVKQPLCLPAPACPLVTSAFRLDIQTSFILPERSVTFTGCHQDNIASRTNYCPESQAGYVSVYFSSWYCIFCEKNSFYTSLMVK